MNWFTLIERPVSNNNTYIFFVMLLRYPRCLVIAGSDSSGGAGLQADIKTLSSIGVYATNAVTAITAQNSICVSEVMPIPSTMIEAQIKAVLTDIGTNSVKIGMLPDADSVDVVVNAIQDFSLQNVVLDTVMLATTGYKLISDDAINYIRQELLNKVTVATPNISEAEVLSGIKIIDMPSLYRAGEMFLHMGTNAVVIKGGHMQGELATDVLFTQYDNPMQFSVPFYDTKNTHGTGCTFSSAIAGFMAKGYDLKLAVKEAKTYLTQAIWSGAKVTTGVGQGPVNHLHSPQSLIPEAHYEDLTAEEL